MIKSCDLLLIIYFLLILPDIGVVSQQTQNELERKPPEFVTHLNVNPFHSCKDASFAVTSSDLFFKLNNSAGSVLKEFLKVFEYNLKNNNKNYKKFMAY